MRRTVLILMSLLLLSLAAWRFVPRWREGFPGTGNVLGDRPDPSTYLKLCADLEKRRSAMERQHRNARSEGERALIEAEARTDLERTLPAMMKCWLGTP